MIPNRGSGMKIGLTGGIASGKSMAARRLRTLGAYVLDADDVSRELTRPGGALLAPLAAEFGGGILTAHGELDRRALGAIVFFDKEKLARLNAITHPAIIRRMHRLADEYLAARPDGVAVLDMALLIECGEHKNVDAVWLVTAPEKTRLARIMARDGCTEEEALSRMAAQLPQEEKEKYADVIIKNDGGIAELFEKVDALYAALERP